MNATEIQEHARKMWEISGPQAVAEAAQKAREFEAKGDAEQAETWRRIESALMLRKGPREG